MDAFTSRPVEEVDKKLFSSRVRRPVEVSPHAFDHLDGAQRKVFKKDALMSMVESERPRKVFLQENGRYAAFYRREDGYRKLIISVEDTKSVIVSFMDTPEIPRYKL